MMVGVPLAGAFPSPQSPGPGIGLVTVFGVSGALSIGLRFSAEYAPTSKRVQRKRMSSNFVPAGDKTSGR
jgi:hypothetical protein